MRPELYSLPNRELNTSANTSMLVSLLSLESLRLLWRPRSKKPLQFEPGRVDSHHSLRVVTAHCFAKLCVRCVAGGLGLCALLNQNTETRKHHKSPLLPVAQIAVRSYWQQWRLDAANGRGGSRGSPPRSIKKQ